MDFGGRLVAADRANRARAWLIVALMVITACGASGSSEPAPTTATEATPSCEQLSDDGPHNPVTQRDTFIRSVREGVCYETQISGLRMRFTPTDDSWRVSSNQYDGDFAGTRLEWRGPSRAGTLLQILVFDVGTDEQAAWDRAAGRLGFLRPRDEGVAQFGASEATWREWASPSGDTDEVPGDAMDEANTFRIYVAQVGELTATLVASPGAQSDELTQWRDELEKFLETLSFPDD